MKEEKIASPLYGAEENEVGRHPASALGCEAEPEFLSRTLIADLDNSDLTLGIAQPQGCANGDQGTWYGGMMEFDFSTFAGASEALGLDPLSFGAPLAATIPVAGADAADLALGLHARGVDFLYTSLIHEDTEIFPEQNSPSAAPAYVEQSVQNETVLNLHFPSYGTTTEDESRATALAHAQHLFISG